MHYSHGIKLKESKGCMVQFDKNQSKLIMLQQYKADAHNSGEYWFNTFTGCRIHILAVTQPNRAELQFRLFPSKDSVGWIFLTTL